MSCVKLGMILPTYITVSNRSMLVCNLCVIITCDTNNCYGISIKVDRHSERLQIRAMAACMAAPRRLAAGTAVWRDRPFIIYKKSHLLK